MRWLEAAAGLAILLGVCLLAWASQDSTQVAKDGPWLTFTHESGTTYLIRVEAVLAVVEPVPGDPEGKAGLLLQGGHVITTTASLDEFKKVTGVKE